MFTLNSLPNLDALDISFLNAATKRLMECRDFPKSESEAMEIVTRAWINSNTALNLHNEYHRG